MSFALHPAQLWAKRSMTGGSCLGVTQKFKNNNKAGKNQHKKREVSYWRECRGRKELFGGFSWIIFLKDNKVCIGSYWIRSSKPSLQCSGFRIYSMAGPGRRGFHHGWSQEISSSHQGSECHWIIHLLLKIFVIFYKILELKCHFYNQLMVFGEPQIVFPNKMLLKNVVTAGLGQVWDSHTSPVRFGDRSGTVTHPQVSLGQSHIPRWVHHSVPGADTRAALQDAAWPEKFKG